MKRLYIETNYIISQAFQQDHVASTIFLKAAKVGAEICLPSFCVQEALTTIQLRRKSTDKFGRSLQQKLEELRADRSQTASSLKAMLNNSILENGKLQNERELRIASVIVSLNAARFVHIEHAIAPKAVATPIIRGAADNLIMHVVLEDAISKPLADMALFTQNWHDFKSSNAQAALHAARVSLLTTSNDVISWL